jgi:hypothetical protein
MGHRLAYPAAVAGKRRGNNDKQTLRLTVSRRLLIAAAVWFAACFAGSAVHAQSGPFAGLDGGWHGGGTVSLDDGSTERIRCRANYAVAGSSMDMTLTCASDAYRFNLQARVVSERGTITGNWSESSRNVSGSLQGHGGNGSFQIVAGAAGFNAEITLSTHGNRQSIVMRADSQFRGASISLSR